jgi:translation initiation factor IF-3
MERKEIRLVGNNVENGIYQYLKAKDLAEELGLDLVLVTTKGEPHVYKLVDRNKDLYQQKMRKKEQQKNSKKTVVKEMRIGANIGDHDYEIKKAQLTKFLKKGAKVKISMQFKGRNIIHKDLGHILLLKLATELEEHGKVEALPKLLGKRMIMQISPK